MRCIYTYFLFTSTRIHNVEDWIYYIPRAEKLALLPTSYIGYKLQCL